MSVAEIKEQAKQEVQRFSRGDSALSLIQLAKGQNAFAQVREGAGDLKAALSALTKAATLIQLFVDSTEFKAQNVPRKRGLLWKEFSNFQQREGIDLTQRTLAIESKLTQVEKSVATPLNGHHSPPPENGVGNLSRGSIADRMRSLQDAGLRVSRELPTTTAVPLSSTSTSSDRTRTIRNSLQARSPVSPPISHSAPISSKISTLASAAHSFASLSALGPPSSSSSRTSLPTAEEFSQAFPSINELEEIDRRRSASNVRTSVIVISSDKDEEPLSVPKRGSRKPIRLRAEGEILQISDKKPVKVEEPELESLRQRYHELEQERNMLRDDNKHLSATMNQLKATTKQNALNISALDDAISCDVCTDTMWSPYLLSNCGHTFCQGCLTNWFNTTLAHHRDIGARGKARYTCPTCRLPARAAPVQNISLKRIVRLAAESRGKSSPRRPQAPPSPPPPHRDSSPGPFGAFFRR